MVRFISVKSCITLSERPREWAGYLDSGKERQKDTPLLLLTAPLVASLTGILRVKEKRSNKYLWERGKSMVVLQRGPWWLFVQLPHTPFGLGKNRLLLYYPVSFLTFLWLVPSPYQISFLDSPSPSPNLIISLNFPRLVSSPLNGSHLGSYCPGS